MAAESEPNRKVFRHSAPDPDAPYAESANVATKQTWPTPAAADVVQPRELSAEEFVELAMMGQTRDLSLRLAPGAAERMLTLAKYLASATPKEEAAALLEGPTGRESELQIAERIAREAHAGQKEESTGDDYIRHVERVVALSPEGDQVKAVAWLHDAIEDSNFTAAELGRAGVSEAVVDAVVLLTRADNGTAMIVHTYQQYIDSIKASGNLLAIAVKIADLRDHLRPNCPERLRPRYEKALRILTHVHQDASVQGKAAQEKVNERTGTAQAGTRDTEESHGLADTGESNSSASPSPIGSITRVAPPEALDARLAAIQEREQKATKGPWTSTWNIKFGVKIWGRGIPLFSSIAGAEHSRVSEADPVPQWQKDVDFAQAAREDIPYLLSLVQALREERDASLTSVVISMVRFEQRRADAAEALVADLQRQIKEQEREVRELSRQRRER
jgi:hypothetical protein